MARKPLVFEHEGKLYATTSYEPVNETKLADAVKDISQTLEDMTGALQQYRELEKQFPQAVEAPAPVAEPVPPANEPVTEQAVASDAPVAEVAQPASASVETVAQPEVTQTPVETTPVAEAPQGVAPEAETPPAEAVSVETVHIQ
jgi:hypothetical protein